MSTPWLKFYTSDWRSDPRLRMCSMAARGLWVEVICLMHEATPYGHLLVSGQCPTDTQLAVLVGASPGEIPALLGELEAAGVFSRTKEGVIYSRKLSRMAKKAATARNNGRKGGNPTLSKERRNPPSDNPQDKGGDKPQKPEARVQSKREAKASLGASPPNRFQEFWDAYPHRGGAKRKRKDSEARYARHVRAGVSEQEIIDGALRAHGDRTVQSGYARDPVAWLNQRGWEDEIEPTPPPKGKPHDTAEDDIRWIAERYGELDIGDSQGRVVALPAATGR